MLPYIDSVLTYDTPHLSNQAIIDHFACAGQVSQATIDYTTKTITIAFQPGTKLTSLNPAISVSAGARILPAANTAIDLSGGTATYVVTSENGAVTSKWIVKVKMQ